MSPEALQLFAGATAVVVNVGFALAAVLAINYLVNKRRSARRPVGVTCKRCGKRYDTTATSKAETIAILYGAMAVHAAAAHPPTQERPGEHTLAFEWRASAGWKPDN